MRSVPYLVAAVLEVVEGVKEKAALGVAGLASPSSSSSSLSSGSSSSSSGSSLSSTSSSASSSPSSASRACRGVSTTRQDIKLQGAVFTGPPKCGFVPGLLVKSQKRSMEFYKGIGNEPNLGGPVKKNTLYRNY